MSNLDQIVKKIIEDAKTEADQILAQTRKESDQILETSKEHVSEEVDVILEHAKTDAKLTKERELSTIERQARDLILEARQETITRIFNLAIDELKDMDDETYKKGILSYIQKKQLTKDKQIVLPACRKNIQIDGFNCCYDDQFLTGFKIQSDGICENHDYVELVQYLKEDLIQYVLDELKKVIYEA